MIVYNKDKKTIVSNPDLSKGKIITDVITVQVDETPRVDEKGHYEVITEYPNGGKEVRWIIDTPAQEYIPSYEKKEEIQIYIPYSKKELKAIEDDLLRGRREIECFPIVNRGKLWYDTLTDRQLNELDVWYHQWLDVTKIKIIPDKPTWLF